MTIEEVAAESGVSIATVSNYLNQKYGSMSEATKERIAEVVRRLNYRPNVLAQGLKANKSRTIAVVVVNIGYPFCVSIIQALSTVFAQQDYRLLVCETGENGENERKILESLLAQQVEAMVIQATGDNNQLIEQISSQMPVVLVDREYPIVGATKVLTNNEDMSEQLTASLFHKGYDEVIFVMEFVSGVSTRAERLAGYKRACEAFGREPSIVLVNRRNPDSFHAVVAELQQRQSDEPFAVYTGNGLIMQQLYPLLLKLNKRVPHEMGLATFDDPDWASLLTPPLTTVSQPTQEIGEFCANTIIRLLQNPQKRGRRMRKVVCSKLLLKASTELPRPNGE